jgi:hypothetical protein
MFAKTVTSKIVSSPRPKKTPLPSSPAAVLANAGVRSFQYALHRTREQTDRYSGIARIKHELGDAMSPTTSAVPPSASVELPPTQPADETTPLLIIGTGRASMTLVAHLPERALVGALVVDPSGEWLESWALRVMGMGATHVRSSISMTPFPDADGLRAFCEKRGNRNEDVFVGDDDHAPVPSCHAFAEYCGSRVRQDSRFRRVRVLADRVVRLDPVPGGGLRATLASGGAIVAAQVAHGGAWRVPVVPSWMSAALRMQADSGDTDSTLALANDVDVTVSDLENRAVVVVGAGATAFTLAAAARRAGACSVTVVCRGGVTVRDRECDVAFYGNKGIAQFKAIANPETRASSFRKETSASVHALVFDAAAQSSAVTVLEQTNVDKVTWCGDTKTWRAELSSNTTNQRSRVIEADVVWTACGDFVDASRDPIVQSLLARTNDAGRVAGGFPVLVEDDDADPDSTLGSGTGKGKGAASPEAIGPLRWPGLPLYFVGRYASLGVGPVAKSSAGNRIAARAVALAMRAHAARKRRGLDPYARGLSQAQTVMPTATGTRETDAEGVPLKLRLVPEHLRGGRALMDARELMSGAPGIDVDGPVRDIAVKPPVKPVMQELAQYQTIDDDFVLEVRLTLPEAVRADKVRVAFEERSVEVFAIGEKTTFRFFVPKLFKPVIVERCRYEVAKSGKRISLFLHKYDDNEWRFLKG